MGFTSRDMYAKVDIDMFRRALIRSRLSYQELADDATKELRRIVRSEKKKNRGANLPETISKALIGQIASGTAKTTHELRAVAIERALSASDGDLFTPKVLRGAGTAQRHTA